MHTRNYYFDYLKGIIIILVVLGHCIQYGSGADFYRGGGYLNDILMKVIYSFHMPILMLISGYFSYNSIERSNGFSYISKRFNQFVKPISFYSILIIILNLLKNGLSLYTNLVAFCISLFLSIFWFLLSIIFCLLIIVPIEKLVKNSRMKVMFYLIVFLFFFVTPDICYLGAHKYMFPYFVIGFYSNRLNLMEKIFEQNKYFILAFFVLWLFLLHFFYDNTYIYISGYSLISTSNTIQVQIYLDIFRFVIGLVGSVFCISFTKKIYSSKYVNKITKKILIYLGQHTLAIYILSSLLLEKLLPIISKSFTNNYCYNAIEAFVTILVCVFIIKVIPNNIVKKWILGE